MNHLRIWKIANLLARLSAELYAMKDDADAAIVARDARIADLEEQVAELELAVQGEGLGVGDG